MGVGGGRERGRDGFKLAPGYMNEKEVAEKKFPLV